AKFAPQIEFGASLKVREGAVRDVGAVQETCVGNRVAEAEINKGGERIESVGKMIVPVNCHVSRAQHLRRACGRERAAQAGAEIKSKPFRGISETQVRVPHAIRGGRARLRGRRLDEEVWYAHVHGKVFAEDVANGRVYVRDESIRVPAAFISLRPCESPLLDAAFTCRLRLGLGRG